mmetsp:Transcript_25970/g.39131  ORF Transcript_25970/g.39131 Transcript_25970/m.39131 type:complete len:352 (-) Transcript_25970:182-1237(-)
MRCPSADLRQVRHMPPHHNCTSSFTAGRIPDFIIVSADKTGSTGIYGDLVTGHRSISNLVACKETRFFHRLCRRLTLYNSSCTADVGEYRRLFARCPDLLVGEASPAYYANPCAARLIRCTLPEVRLMMFCRDPVARFLSRMIGNYEHQTNKSWLTCSEMVANYDADRPDVGHPIDIGRYARILQSIWAPHFDLTGADGSFLILPTEWFEPSNESLARQSLNYVAAYLGVSPWTSAEFQRRVSRRKHVGSDHISHMKLALMDSERSGKEWANLYQNRSGTSNWMCSADDLEWLRLTYRDDNADLRGLMNISLQNLVKRNPYLANADISPFDLPRLLTRWAAGKQDTALGLV